MKVLVTGAKGQLGADVALALSKQDIANMGVDQSDFDIADINAVNNTLQSYMPDAVIHCAAYTAVDKAEDEPDICRLVNEDGTRNIALACKEIGAKMLYISTDYVFHGNGDHFHLTTDSTRPMSVYGKTKLAGEKAVLETLSRAFIVRISWVFGEHGNNFVKTMLRLGKEQDNISVVCDQIGSPTYTVDLALLLCQMILSEKYGVYHATNEGVCSWAEFARAIFLLADLNVAVNPILSSAYPTKATRPLNSRLDKSTLYKAGFMQLPYWQNALRRYLANVQLLN